MMQRGKPACFGDADSQSPRQPIRIPRQLVRCLVLLVIGGVAAPTVFAQAEEQGEQRQLPTSSRVESSLGLLRKAVQRGNASGALNQFGRLVTVEPGILIPRPNHRQYVPLHRRLAEEFDDWPPEFQNAWRNTTEQTARIALRDVVRSRQWSSLLEVIRRYPGTESGLLA